MKFKTPFFLSLFLLSSLLFSGCSWETNHFRPDGATPSPIADAGLAAYNIEEPHGPTDITELTILEPSGTKRMIARSGEIMFDAESVPDATKKVADITVRRGGFVESQKDWKTGARLELRIPEKDFNAALAEIEALGCVTRKEMKAKDITVECVDLDSRLKNKLVLRDRLKQLLEKAVEVKDILQIETELNRTQSDIDSMESRLKYLRSQVAYASLEVGINEKNKTILGPLTYAFMVPFWCIKKLFIIRD